MLDASSDAGSDGILSPGEMWIYEAGGVAQDLGGAAAGSLSTFNLTGSSDQDGSNGNIRTFSSDGISVNASAFSRDSGGTWAEGFLGSFSGGLGVTDTAEDDGSSGRHRVDNVDRDNYVLFEFSETVIVDQAFLASVVDDSDISVWIGTADDPFNNHLTLGDTLLSGLGFTEVNTTTSSNSRWADINATEVAGNVLVIAASTGDPKSNDKFKIEKVEVQRTEPGCYENMAVVTADGVSDSDLSHYCNPDDPTLPTMTMFEAEDYEKADHPWQIFNSSDASGGQFIKAPNGTGSHYKQPPSGSTVTYNFEVDMAGQYAVSGLVKAPDSDDNSFWIKVDDSDWVQWHTDLTGSQWQWQDVTSGSDKDRVAFDLSVGEHTLKIKVREDGTKLDKIKISKAVD